MLEHVIRFTHRHVGTNSYAYIPSSLDVDVSQDQQWFVLNPRAKELNAKDLALDAVGKGNKKKIAKRELAILGEIKACSGLANSKGRIKSINGQLELTDTLGRVSRIYQAQRSKKKMETTGCYDGPCSKYCTKTLKQGWWTETGYMLPNSSQ